MKPGAGLWKDGWILLVGLACAALGGCSGGTSEPGGADGGVPDAPSGTDSGSGGSSGSSSGSSSGGSDAGPVTSADGFGASRAACITKINALRATSQALALQPYTLQDTGPIDACVDAQASNDQSKSSAHYSFTNGAPSCTWGSPPGTNQNECLGFGTTPSAIETCIQTMWDESLMPNCSGCVGCTAFGGACANCDYFGQMGYACGDYVNLSAPYFSMVACGFAGASPSSSTGWSVVNFE